MNEPAIQLENVTLRFKGAGIERFSLEVQAGEKVVLAGPSGSGKSTVVRCIMGFAKPDDGVIRIYGEPLTAESVWRLRSRMAFVAQEPELGFGIVEDVLQRPFRFSANAPRRYDRGRVTELFQMLRLPLGLLTQEVRTLSGGEKQRIALISAIILQRDLFIMDEVSSALDDENSLAVADFFRTRDELTALLATHKPAEFVSWDRVVPLAAAQQHEHSYE